MPESDCTGNETKRCGRCKEWKPLTEYHKHRSTPDGLQNCCKDCNRTLCRERLRAKIRSGQARVEYKKRYKVKRWTKLLNQYGITRAEYEELESKQDFKCAICEQPEARMYKDALCRLIVDHDHETGKIRGLLCYSCNLGLGCFKDDPERLKRAANYLNEE